MRSLSARRLVVVLAALGLAAGACTSSDAGDTADTSAAQPERTTGTVGVPTSATDPPATQLATGDAGTPPASAAEATAVPAALQFTAPLVGGGEFDGAAVADKPTVFWFWAPT